jgi:RNA polymerase sigma-70 factor (ECF subfamily)
MASPAEDDGPETEEFDRELRRALFHQASEQVRREVRPQTWQAFWEVAVAGVSVAETASKLGMTAGAVRVAKCRMVARLRQVVAEMEKAI